MFQFSNTLRSASLALAVAASACAPMAAHAASPADASHTAVVDAHGLDLTTDAGVTDLHRRALLAAERVCRMEDANTTDVANDDFTGCVGRMDRAQQPWIARRVAEAATEHFAQAGKPATDASFQSASAR